MANFKIKVSKGSQGEIEVQGQFVSGKEAIYVEKVVIAELDSNNNPVGFSTHAVNMSIDPVPGFYLLVSKMPFGSQTKAASATVNFMEMGQIQSAAVPI